MSFFKKLFGGGKSAGKGAGGEKPAGQQEYEGYLIEATPMSEGGQYRLCGVISKEIDGEMKSHKVIRSDIFSGKDQCVEFTFMKCQRVIDEQGDRLF